MQANICIRLWHEKVHNEISILLYNKSLFTRTAPQRNLMRNDFAFTLDQLLQIMIIFQFDMTRGPTLLVLVTPLPVGTARMQLLCPAHKDPPSKVQVTVYKDPRSKVQVTVHKDPPSKVQVTHTLPSQTFNLPRHSKFILYTRKL